MGAMKRLIEEAMDLMKGNPLFDRLSDNAQFEHAWTVCEELLQDIQDGWKDGLDKTKWERAVVSYSRYKLINDLSESEWNRRAMELLCGPEEEDLTEGRN